MRVFGKPLKRWQINALLLLAVLALPFVLLLTRPTPPPAVPVCLLTGFEPFGGHSVNSSWEMLKPLEGQTVAGHRVATARLPVVYDEVAGPLQAAIEKHRPALVISFGMGTEVVQVELVARNGYHLARPEDNLGRGPPREKIVPGGPDEIPTQLPAAEIIRALQAAGIGAGDSDDADGYLCNECFYRVMSLKKEGAAANVVRRGFVHVPVLGWPDPAGGQYTLEKLERAARIIIQQTAAGAAHGSP